MELLKLIKRKSADSNIFDEKEQNGMDGVITAYNELQKKYSQLVEEKNNIQFEEEIKNSSDKDIVEGALKVVSTLKTMISSKRSEKKSEPKYKKKAELLKNLFKEFEKIDSNFEEEKEEEANSQCSTIEGSSEDENEMLLGKRNFSELEISEPVIDFLPKKYAMYGINQIEEEDFMGPDEVEFSIDEMDQTSSFFNFL